MILQKLNPLAVLLVGVASFVTVTLSFHVRSNDHLEPRYLQQKKGQDQSTHSLGRRSLPTGTCNAKTPCENAACCGTNGLCGYSPTNCGKGSCTSNCDAKAECGQYGKKGSQNCPLGVCCSQFGFCGSTNDFCDPKKHCQKDFGGCGHVKRPTCSGNSITKRTIGYYESWSNTRKCDSVSPEDLNLNAYSHINFAFAFFDPTSFEIAPMDSASGKLYSRFTALKDKNTGLQTWISVGGWSFTDPGPTQNAFSAMTSTATNRKKFITGLISFMNHYGFDGVDLDWEYPQADDRGGVSSDKANYVFLARELKQAFGTRYGISMTLPTSYWYLQHFDLASLQPNVDWFNFMSYDLHGVWDAQSHFIGPFIAPHTNVTEIDAGLDLLWRAGVKPEKVVMGLGWYGRSFTLADASCNKPDGACKFTGGAHEGPCSAASGIPTLKEISDIITKEGVKPVWDKTAMVKYVTWKGDQWVSYDDNDTFDQKRKFANSRCLGGTMIWAMDQRDQHKDNGVGPAPGITTNQQKEAKQMGQDLVAGASCYTTNCGAKCRKGTNKVTEMNGQPGKLTTNDRCPAKKYRSLCCDDGTTLGSCQWRGYRGHGLSCMGGCADGETELVQNTNNHRNKKKNGDQTCTGGIQSYCCKGFKPAGVKVQPPKGKKKEKKAKDAAKAVAEQAVSDIAAQAFCRVAVPALLAPLEAAEALIPAIGEVADIVEAGLTPGLIKVCFKGVEKEGKAGFKVFGKKHTINFDKRSTTVARKPQSSHSPAKTSTCPGDKILLVDALVDVGGGRACSTRARRTVTSRGITTEIQLVRPPHPTAITCDGHSKGYTQACLNYKSIQDNYPQYATITCPYRKIDGAVRPIVSLYNVERKTELWDPLIHDPDGCSPDEYPPAVMIEPNDGYHLLSSMAWTMKPIRHRMSAKPAATRGQMVRYLNSIQNRDAGQLFKVCRAAPRTGVAHDTTSAVVGPRNVETKYYFTKMRMTRSEFTLVFANLGHLPDDGVTDNDCVPTYQGAKRYGYALLNDDKWFDTQPAEMALQSVYPRGPHGGGVQEERRWVKGVGLIITDGNSTRVATARDMEEGPQLASETCEAETCSRGMEGRKRLEQDTWEQAGIDTTAPLASLPTEAPIESPTLAAEAVAQITYVHIQPGSGPGGGLGQPRRTEGGDVYTTLYSSMKRHYPDDR